MPESATKMAAKRKTTLARRVVLAASDKWPASKVERRKIALLQSNPNNARVHSDEQIRQIAASIREWGWTQPILIDGENNILAGHGRAAAARRMAIKEVPVVVARNWSEAQKRAYGLADNQVALNAGWDKALLTIELGELRELETDLSLTGFSDSELKRLLDAESEVEKDAVAQLDAALKYSVVVRCNGEMEQRELLERFERQGLKCEALIS